MESKVFGYARVSSAHQKEDRQVEALKKFGIDERNIIIDKVLSSKLEAPVSCSLFYPKFVT